MIDPVVGDGIGGVAAAPASAADDSKADSIAGNAADGNRYIHRTRGNVFVACGPKRSAAGFSRRAGSRKRDQKCPV